MASAADMLFDLEGSEQDFQDENASSVAVSPQLELIARRLELTARHPSELARQLHRDVTNDLERMRVEGHSASLACSLGTRLAVRGYDVYVRIALGGGTDCFKSLRHEFLVVRGSDEFSGMEFIVEPSLRQHFTIPHPSPEYAFALAATPDVFVGGSCRLVSIIQLLCALMADSFERQGLPLPPWRREAAMLSKWMPNPSRLYDMRPPAAVSRSQSERARVVAEGAGAALSTSRSTAAAESHCCADGVVGTQQWAAAADHICGAATPAVPIAQGCGISAAVAPQVAPPLPSQSPEIPSPFVIAAAAIARAARCPPIEPTVAITGFSPRAGGGNLGRQDAKPAAAAAAAALVGACGAPKNPFTNVSQSDSEHDGTGSDFDCGSISRDRSLDASSVFGSSGSPGGGGGAAACCSILAAACGRVEAAAAGVGSCRRCTRSCSVVLINLDGDGDDYDDELVGGDDCMLEKGTAARDSCCGFRPRGTATGMLPCRNSATSMLSVRMVLGSIGTTPGVNKNNEAAVAVAAPPPPCPPAATAAAECTGEVGMAVGHVETRAPVHPSAPTIHLVRLGWPPMQPRPQQQQPQSRQPGAGHLTAQQPVAERSWLPWALPAQ